MIRNTSDRDRNIIRRPLAAAGVAVLLATGAGIAAAAPAQAAANCTYQANADVQVRENPSVNSIVLKTKQAGSVMTGGAEFCNPQTGTDGRSWYWVYTDSASDGIGWVIADKISVLSPS